MPILRDVKSYSRKLVIKEMVRMLPKLSMKDMWKIIDHPHALREVVRKCHAYYPTHDGVSPRA